MERVEPVEMKIGNTTVRVYPPQSGEDEKQKTIGSLEKTLSAVLKCNVRINVRAE